MEEVIGIIGAMDAEVRSLCAALKNEKKTEVTGFTYHQGELNGKKVVVVQCGIGKVNAAICTQSLILNFKVTKVINTGIAGATGAGLKIFDFVVSTATVYHDFDTTAFGYKIGQVPHMVEQFPADEKMIDTALKAFNETKFSKEHKIVKGLIASGDQFISGGERKDFIKKTFSPFCVEMEGCAIAHTCHVNKVPFIIIRCMSDMADDDVEVTYNFNEETCAEACAEFIKTVVQNF